MLGATEKIGEPCQTPFNVGFLTHLYAIRTEDVLYVHTPTGNSLFQPSSAVGIKPGAIITEFLTKAKTATFTESSSENADGVSYNLAISFPMKGSATSLTNWVHQNQKRRYIILVRDTLGNCYLIGDYENGARVTWSRQVTSTSMHQLSFNLINWYPIQYITTIDLENIFPNREFDYSFDISFS
jgi:hypothetical protein